MKQVTIETVRERMNEIELWRGTNDLRISLREEFELACLRQLLAAMDSKPVVRDEMLLQNLETRINSLEIGERKGALSTQQATSLKAYRLAVQCLRSSATSDENATDNTAQQFEALAVGMRLKKIGTVTLPERLDIDGAFMVPVDDGDYLDRDEVIEAIRAAGMDCREIDGKPSLTTDDVINALATSAGSGKP